ncbi:probable 2-oxoglutarate-dependent dioxygenase ANS [Ananas comosus]|uniref:Fe2OG dioxygenase domain-containing protein n=2 Tax=Ananas comosus TaxID=4615 RepID=A0A6V7NUN1_ANACO|nr:probable 2-oxoglutarate-dependent dioxygenase ANS [Ananas comosus]CAD1822321.1 unnamed protein product [Ananas comosus var. bracteatus]
MESPQRVQTLAESGLSLLPEEYIQPPDLRPNRSTDTTTFAATVPIVDLASSHGGPLPELRRACAEWGAFHVVNHGVPLRLLDAIRGAGLSFFAAPMAEKLRFACDPASPASEGYGSRMLAKDDGVLDWRDYFDHHTLPESRRNPSRWPGFVPSYRDIVVEYSNSMKELAQKLLHLISRSLDLPPSYIEEAVGEVYQNITISYYSPCPQPELALGLQAHSDMGTVTLLIQDDVGGLEVLKDGEWVIMQPLPDAIVVILADQMEIISNGEYRSAQHRAIVNSNRARLSVATFYDPSKARKIYPAPQLINEHRPAKYREVLYGDYVSSWYSKGPEGKRNIDALLIQ